MINPRISFLRVSEESKHVCSIGKYCYAADSNLQLNFYRGPECKLVIGNFVSIGPRVTIYVGGEHYTDWVSTYHFSEIFGDVESRECIKTKGNVVIGSDVWIGGNVIILSGVTIGHGAVIGAGSVVSKDVEPYSIVAGNPIRELRKRFTEEQREKLLQIRWWEWDDEWVDRFIPMIMNNDIANFIRLAEEVIEVGRDKSLTNKEVV